MPVLVRACLVYLPFALAAADFEREVKPFFKQHCFSCHDATKAKAGFRIDTLGTDFLAGKNAEHWHEVMSQISSGEMPPEDKPRPEANSSQVVVEWISARLREAEQSARLAGGRVVMRRLTRNEFAYTVGDLLQLDPHLIDKLREELPADGKADGFDRLSSALFVDQTHLEQYLHWADVIAHEAIRSAPPKSNVVEWQAKAARRGEKTSVDVYQGAKNQTAVGFGTYEVRPDGILAWSGSGTNLQNTGFIHIPSGPGPGLDKVVTSDGYYRIRVRGGGYRGARGEPIVLRLTYARGTPIESTHLVTLTGSLDAPTENEITVHLRAGQEGQQLGMGLTWNGLDDVRVKHPRLAKLESSRLGLTNTRQKAVTAGDTATADKLRAELDAVLAELHAFTEPMFALNPKYRMEDLPKLLLDRIVIEGPVVGTWPPASHVVLGLNEQTPQTGAGARAVFTRLLPQAYRRPVTDEEIARYVRITERAMSTHGLDFHAGLRLALQAMLVSPGFMYLQEPLSGRADDKARALTGHELATRMAYLLWSSTPDAELTTLAANGRLLDRAVLAKQVTRLLDDPRSRRFVSGFAGQWLDVDLIGSVAPAKEYKDYDDALEAASRLEPVAFAGEVLAKDLPITSFIDSDFLVINERLARHYGIDGVTGSEFRRVAITPAHRRGGVLGMAGLLTYLADGTRTLPVRRGAWVLEKLLDDPPPPPPPNAGEIQPNTAGKNLTVRERLQRHRDEATCASCHAKLDPYGLALENYDAIGAWRDRQNGEGIRATKAPPIDASGVLKSGRAFSDLAQYKAALLAERERFVQAFAKKLLTYALGRPVGYVDQATITQVVTAAERDGLRLRSMIQAIVASEPFLSK